VTSARAFTVLPAPVFINEIHYDNTGPDANEAIEIAGPAGTDLSSWSLVLYNGNDSAPYDTIRLSGVIPDQQQGFGTLNVVMPSFKTARPMGWRWSMARHWCNFSAMRGTSLALAARPTV
jgi:hypothetical protein